MKLVYDIKKSVENMDPESTLQYKYGLKDKPYWEKVEDNEVDICRIKGVISKIYEDEAYFPCMEVTKENGEPTEWAREVNSQTDNSYYQVGKNIEIVYCEEEYLDSSTQRKWVRKCTVQILVQE